MTESFILIMLLCLSCSSVFVADISKLKIRPSSPARNVPGQKPAIGVKPSLPKDGSVAKPSKPVASQQYNNPIGLYSAAKVDEEREEQTKQVHEVHTGLVSISVLTIRPNFDLDFTF